MVYQDGHDKESILKVFDLGIYVDALYRQWRGINITEIFSNRMKLNQPPPPKKKEKPYVNPFQNIPTFVAYFVYVIRVLFSKIQIGI